MTETIKRGVPERHSPFLFVIGILKPLAGSLVKAPAEKKAGHNCPDQASGRTMKKSCLFLFISIFLTTNAIAQAHIDTSRFRTQRKKMVHDQIVARGIDDPRILTAMAAVPRHAFVPKQLHPRAYDDHPLPIGEGQTISQPYIVALMTKVLELNGNERVLEVGTGSGYQAAVLARVAQNVHSIEIKKKLCRRAAETLADIGFDSIQTRCGDGYFGWPEAAPFDAIMITAAVDHIPPPLVKQLKEGGRLVLPLGNPFVYQNLVLVTKENNDIKVQSITGVLFVPMTGHALERR